MRYPHSLLNDRFFSQLFSAASVGTWADGFGSPISYDAYFGLRYKLTPYHLKK